MIPLPNDSDVLVALGALAGAQVLIVCLSVIIANAYRERALLLHGATTMMGVLAVQTLVGGHAVVAESVMLMVLALGGLQLRELVTHTGAMRTPRVVSRMSPSHVSTPSHSPASSAASTTRTSTSSASARERARRVPA